MPSVALLDANVLYPATLRDLLMELAFQGVHQARWSAEIEDEWARNLRAARPDLAEKIERTQAVMRRAVPDALVTGYEGLVETLALPDRNDRHVLAAAITAEAEVIVTFNLRDFPRAVLARYGVVAKHPDAFLQSLSVTMPTEFLAVVRTCVTRPIRPPITGDEYIRALLRLGLVEITAFLQSHAADWQD